jgi:hypothetical protein
MASLPVEVSLEGVHVSVVLIDHVVLFLIVLLFFFLDDGAVLGFFLGRGRVLPTRHLLYRVLHEVDLTVVNGSVVLVLEDDAREELVVHSALVDVDHDDVVRVPIQQEIAKVLNEEFFGLNHLFAAEHVVEDAAQLWDLH